MSREIKLRVWNKYHQKMFDVYEINFEHKIAKVSRIEDGITTYHTFGFLDSELLEFAGLKDKNGLAEVYEGDIVKPASQLTCSVVFGNYVIGCDDWNIEFKTPCFCLKFNDNSGYCAMSDDLEVIGNIYENHELLEES